MYPPDTYPKDTYPLDTYPLDTYPLDIYPLGHIPPVTSQQTKSRCDNVVATLCFGCGNVVNATLSQRKNVDSKSHCGHVAITTLHSQPARIFMHTHIYTYTHIYTEFDNSRRWSRDKFFFKFLYVSPLSIYYQTIFYFTETCLSSSACVVECICSQNTTQCLSAG